uniref:hypothetical protein n=1 Tax=Flavobacterium sp. TaxID=239 RepID=UPI00404B5389
MNRIIILIFSMFLSLNLISQTKSEYLKENRSDLTLENYSFPQSDFNIIGFGALHGSAKTYETELNLIKSLKKEDLLDYYLIEANYSQAFYFQEYLNTGDEKLLKELTFSFQTMVSQEGTIETFNHWKNLRKLNLQYPNKEIKVIGCDVINEYRFSIRHILSITKDDNSWKEREILKKNQNTDNSTIWNKELNIIVKSFVEDYELNKSKYENLISNVEVFEHIIKNIKYNFEEKREREKIIFNNYIFLHSKLELFNKKQFAKYGYFHIQKNREGNYPSFFTRLIENKVYEKEKVITVMGYLTKSKVLWDKIYDEKGDYKSFTTKAGFGISDYWKEYFKGIKYLKKQKISDQTIYRLNKNNSPYNLETDLVEIKMFLKNFNKTKLKGKNTLQFIDYAVLISNSNAQIPIEEMK